MFPRPAGCVFSLGRKSSSSNKSNRRVLCLIVQTVVQKLVENYHQQQQQQQQLQYSVFGVAKGVFRRLAAPAPAATAAGAAVAPVMFPSEDQQQQQQKHLQQQALCFYQNPEETSSLGTACFWRSFRPSSFLWVSEVTFGIRRKSSSNRSSRRVLWF